MTRRNLGRKKQSRPGCPDRDVFGGCPIQSPCQVSLTLRRSCLLPGYQSVRPPPLPEALHKNHLAMEIASASPTEVRRLFSADPPSSAALSYPLSSRTWDRATRQPEGFRTLCVSRGLYRRVSSRSFRPVMLAGVPGQPGSHSLSATRRSWSSPEGSAALTASLSTFSRGQMKCLPDFRLAASLCGSHRSDNRLDSRHRSRL